MKNRSAPKRNHDKIMNPVWKVFIHTQLLALAVYSVVFLIDSFICLSLDLDRSHMFYFSALSFALSSFICSYFAGFKIHKNGIAVGLIYALPANLIVILISVIVNGFKIDLTVAISIFILLICSMLGGILSVNTKLKPKRK